MYPRLWQKLAQEETDTASVGSTLFGLIVFGGVTALTVLYLLETRTDVPPVLRGTAAILSGLTVGGLAASFRWVRVLAILLVALLALIRSGLVFLALFR
jgi:hypothetical protein